MTLHTLGNYDSIDVNYNNMGFIRLTTGLVVMEKTHVPEVVSSNTSTGA